MPDGFCADVDVGRRRAPNPGRSNRLGAGVWYGLRNPLNSVIGGIPLTQVNPICSVRRRGGLSADVAGVRSAFQYRRGLPRISGPVAVERGLPLPALRRGEGLARARPAVPVCGVRTANLGDGRDHSPRHADPADDVVPSDLVGEQSADGGQRSTACSSRPWPSTRRPITCW